MQPNKQAGTVITGDELADAAIGMTRHVPARCATIGATASISSAEMT
jgi:hypothetical protein